MASVPPPPPKASSSGTLSGLLWGSMAFIVVLYLMGGAPEPTPKQTPPPQQSESKTTTTSHKPAEGVLDRVHPEGSWILEDDTRRLTFSSRGASLAEVLLQIHDESAIRGHPHDLLKPYNPELPHFATFLEEADDLATVNWRLAEKSAAHLLFEIEALPGVRISKKYTLGDNYLLNLEVSVSAIDDRQLTLIQSGANGLEVAQTSGFQRGTYFLSGFFLAKRASGSTRIVDFGFGDLEDGRIWSKDPERAFADHPLTWVGHCDSFFMAMLRPSSPDAEGYLGVLGPDSETTTARIESGLRRVGEGSVDLSCQAYLGPRHRATLTQVDPQLNETLGVGILYPIKAPLLWILEKLYALVGSYGIAVILLTLVVRLLIHPLSRRGQVKMAHYQEKIAKIQPKLTQLKKKFGKDRQAFAKAQMKLMSDNKISGGMMLGGCLPMLMQMPIFLSLYYMLQENIELRGTHFMWIEDLSLPDRLIAEMGFWPHEFNILPLLTLVVTVYQMHRAMSRNSATLTPEQRASQKMMLYIMPGIMLLFTYSFPAGLLLYWFTSALFGIFEAELLRRRVEVLKARGLFH